MVKKSLGWLILCFLGLVWDTNYTCSWFTITLLYFSFLSKCFIPLYKGLSALYSLLGCILAFHLEGLTSFLLILVPWGLHWKASTLGYELWWHYSEVIALLMQPTKWVQSIECGDDGCFICTLPFFACWQIFFFVLGLCPMVLSPSEDTKVSSGSLGIVVSLGLWWVVYIFPEGLLSVPSKVCSSDIGLLSFDLVLIFLSSHIYQDSRLASLCLLVNLLNIKIKK